jgi:hypothetical protein
MRAYLAMLLALPLPGCAGGANLLAGGASFGTEVVARGIIGKIDNDGGLFGQNTSTVINSPEQQAQKERDAALKQRYPLSAGGDKGTIVVNQGQGGTPGGYGGAVPGYGGGYATAGYPQPYGGGGYGYGPPPPPPYYGGGYGRY